MVNIKILHDKENEKVRCAEDVASILRGWVNTLDEIDRDKEHLFALYLGARSQIRAIDVVGVGTVDTCLTHPREIFRRAIALSSTGVIIAHNHPSGECDPSNDDVEMTEILVKAGSILGIPLYDHVIFSSLQYYSMREHRGLMQ